MQSVSEIAGIDEQLEEIVQQFLAELPLSDFGLPRRQFMISIVKSPGVGGTAVGRMLSDLAAAQLVQANSARFLLGKRELAWSRNVHQVCETVVRSLVSRNCPVILDGGGRSKAARQRVKALAAKLGMRVYFIAVLCDPKIAKDRACKRYATRAESTFDDWRATKLSGRHGYFSSIKKLGKELREGLGQGEEREGPAEGVWVIDNSGSPAMLTKLVRTYWNTIHHIETNR